MVIRERRRQMRYAEGRPGTASVLTTNGAPTFVSSALVKMFTNNGSFLRCSSCETPEK